MEVIGEEVGGETYLVSFFFIAIDIIVDSSETDGHDKSEYIIKCIY